MADGLFRQKAGRKRYVQSGTKRPALLKATEGQVAAVKKALRQVAYHVSH